MIRSSLSRPLLHQIRTARYSFNILGSSPSLFYPRGQVRFASRLGDKDHSDVHEFRRTEEGVERDWVNREEKILLDRILKKLGTEPSSVESVQALEKILSRRGIPLNVELKNELVAWKAGLLTDLNTLLPQKYQNETPPPNKRGTATA